MGQAKNRLLAGPIFELKSNSLARFGPKISSPPFYISREGGLKKFPILCQRRVLDSNSGETSIGFFGCQQVLGSQFWGECNWETTHIQLCRSGCTNLSKEDNLQKIIGDKINHHERNWIFVRADICLSRYVEWRVKLSWKQKAIGTNSDEMRKNLKYGIFIWIWKSPAV